MNCSTCGNPSKYTCPACRLRSCSAECVKQHKQKTNCSGQIDPTSFLSKDQLLTATGLDRDYNFLQKISREISVHKDDAHKTRVFKPRDQFRAGVRVRAMGRGMSRVSKNKSRWNNDEKSFEWTVEFITRNGERQYRQVLDKSLVNELYKHVDEDSSKHVCLRDFSGERKPLNQELSLKDALKGLMVLEFPTIEFVEKEEKDTSGSDSSDNDSSDSDSSDSSERDESDESANDNSNETGNDKNDENNATEDQNPLSTTMDEQPQESVKEPSQIANATLL